MSVEGSVKVPGSRRFGLGALLLAACAFPSSANATEWFVAAGSTGNGTSAAPFGSIQLGLNAAQPGDTILVGPGMYSESLRSKRHGEVRNPIVLRAPEGRGSVIVRVRGRVLAIDHAHVVIDGFVFDGEYGPADLVEVNGGADHLVVRNSELRRTSRDAIDISNPEGVLIENSLIHHALNATNGRTDAHGIVAGAVRRLTIRRTEIHTFSGDAIQIDPGRSAPGWTEVTVEGCRLWLAALPIDENGFAVGTVPGENAIDTKASRSLPRAKITIRDTTASGFRRGLITNMAAFNLKENIDADIDGVTISDSEIGFRLRGGRSRSTGAWVHIKNAVIHDTRTAFRYEDNLQNLRVWNTTVGSGVRRVFQAALSPRSRLEVRNLLLLGSTLPREAHDSSNLAVGPDAFESVSTHNYQLAIGSPAIDRGVLLPELRTDRTGTARPHGSAYDIGAYEWHQGEDAPRSPQHRWRPSKTARAPRRRYLPASRDRSCLTSSRCANWG